MLIFVTSQPSSDKCDVTTTPIADYGLVQFGAKFLKPRRERCQTHRRLLNFLKFLGVDLRVLWPTARSRRFVQMVLVPNCSAMSVPALATFSQHIFDVEGEFSIGPKQLLIGSRR